MNKRLRLYSSLNTHKIKPVSEYGEGEILVCGIESSNGIQEANYLLFGCHFVSKATLSDPDKRLKRFTKYREFIETTEKDYTTPPKGITKNYKGSIVFGDFNTNPFEKAFTDSWGLFALDIELPVPKKLNKMKYFINPTLSLLGNFGYNNKGISSAPGTYYFEKKDLEIPTEHFWNAIDGMFFRPELQSLYNKNEPLEIISMIVDKNGITKHTLFDFTTRIIDNDKYSDHLPIKFYFNL
jgi:hypothetical protein